MRQKKASGCKKTKDEAKIPLSYDILSSLLTFSVQVTTDKVPLFNQIKKNKTPQPIGATVFQHLGLSRTKAELLSSCLMNSVVQDTILILGSLTS